MIVSWLLQYLVHSIELAVIWTCNDWVRVLVKAEKVGNYPRILKKKLKKSSVDAYKMYLTYGNNKNNVQGLPSKIILIMMQIFFSSSEDKIGKYTFAFSEAYV